MFRAPNEATLLAVCTGIGAQISVSVYVVLFLMCIFYSASSMRPMTVFFGIISLALCGFLNGFMTSRTLKFFKLQDWKNCAIISALIFPMYILITLSMGDIIESATGSSAAVPWSEGLIHYFIWWAIDGPCAAYGAYRGFNAPLALDPEVGSV